MARDGDRGGWAPAVRDLRAGLAWAALFSAGLSLLMLTVPLYSMTVFDRVLGSGQVETLVLLSLAACLALVVLGALDALRASLLGRAAARFEMALAPAAVEAGFAAGGIGRALRDLASLRQALTGPAVPCLLDLPWLPLSLGAIWLLDPRLAALVGASAVLLLLLAAANDAATGRAARDAAERQQQALALAEAVQRRREAVVGLSMLGSLGTRLARLHAQGLALGQAASSRGGALAGATRSARLLVQCGVMALSAWLVLERGLSPGAMFAASILAGRALAPVEQLVAAWRGVGAAREGWQRLRRLLQEAETPVDRLPMPGARGELAAEAATVRAADGRAVLEGVDLRLRPGTCALVVGPSGAGKSTLCRLLAGTVAPDRGEVRLDGAPLRRHRPEDLARALGYLPQDVGLFAGTVAENIARMAVEPEPGLIVQAAAAAGAHELILRLPEGYETRLEEGGFPLSGGQRQRIGLARALYGGPRLLVLDEPNANLDAAGEAALVASLAGLKARGTTIVIVTHRPNLSRLADLILVVEGGRIARSGPRDEVLPGLLQPARAA